tara:strand:+ start:4726 stop:7731 length:3006 start_codon:yes stop_codon:yes gene_type:complete
MSNILGLPFEPWVKKQIDTRQEVLGKLSNIPTSYLQSYNSKSPFLRLASAVDVTDKGPKDVELKNSVYKQLLSTGLTAEQISGNKLARTLILQGGVVSQPSGSSSSGLQAGLNTLASGSFNGAYGWGGIEERGFVPMPGITNADVTYYNNGALSKTIINIKCFSLKQFQLIDVLYLRPGYTLLLEFGWSMYLNNDKKLISMDQFLTQPMSDLLKGGGSQYDLYSTIEKEREKHFGNYDAIYGKVTKFNWQFNPDGSYDCQVQLTAVGDVIESLKIDINSPKPKTAKNSGGGDDTTINPEDVSENTEQAPLIANKDKSLLHKEMYVIDAACKKRTSDNSTNPKWLSYLVRVPNQAVFKIKNSILVVPVSAGDDDDNESPQVYLKYGALIAFIERKLLLYSKNGNASIPLVRFDMNYKDLDDDDNVVLTFPGQFSSDPKVCLIPYSDAAVPGETAATLQLPDTLLNTVLKTGLNSFIYNDDIYLMRLANIMVNTRYIEKTLTSLMPTNGSDGVSLISYLNSLNKGIIEALGGVNAWECTLSQNGGEIQFIEKIPQRLASQNTKDSKLELTRFNVYGVRPDVGGSFVRNINLRADLSNNFATMISIGAQANGNQLSENATAFSNYNAGLKDRIIPEKFSSPATSEEGDEDDPIPSSTLIKNFKTNIFDPESNDPTNKLMETVYSGDSGKPSLVSDNISSLKAFNKTYAEGLFGILCTEQPNASRILASPFFLPFNLSLEMDGISGIKLYQKFLITDNVLPPSYQNDSVDLTITGVNQKIDSDGWVTKLDTLSTPANKNAGAAIRPTVRKASTGQVYSSGAAKDLPVTSVTSPPPGLDPLAVTRFNAMQDSYNYVFERDGEKSGMCARWTYNMAQNYVRYLRGKSPAPRQIPAGGNANNNNEYYNNLTRLGYTQTKSSGISRALLATKLKTTVWGYGDVVVYYANDKPKTGSISHYQYGHTQIYVGNINSPGWSTSTQNNYNTDFVYLRKPSFNWNLIIFRAPEE